MKSALNGGLNLSIKDGWWDEWFDGENGWQIPSADGVKDADRRDELESAALYDLIETVVAPLFYDAGGDGLPGRWLEMVAHTFRTLGPRVQASRMVRDYVTDRYVPAARASRLLAGPVVAGPVVAEPVVAEPGRGAVTAASAGSGPGGPGGGQDGRSFAAARELAAWKHRVSLAWDGVRIEHVEAEDGRRGPGDGLLVRASVALGKLSPADVAVEVVGGRVSEDDEIVEPVASGMSLDDASGDAGIARYVGQADLGAPGPFGYTVRVVPRHPLLAGSAEMGLVTFPEAPAGMTNGDLR
jgi:starch phosphorylase